MGHVHRHAHAHVCVWDMCGACVWDMCLGLLVGQLLERLWDAFNLDRRVELFEARRHRLGLRTRRSGGDEARRRDGDYRRLSLGVEGQTR